MLASYYEIKNGNILIAGLYELLLVRFSDPGQLQS